MPITFENVIFDRIIEALQGLLTNEFSIPVYFDTEEARGNQYFVLTPASDSLVEQVPSALTRGYAIDIFYQLKLGGAYTKNTFKQVSNIAERVKRLVFNNTAYSPSDVYKWHDGSVETIEYERDEDSPELINATISFSCVSMEVTT